jgi:hypothetical protein
MADEGPRADDVEAGQRVYTPLTLRVYDLFVLGFSNRLVWRCPSSNLLERYESHVGARHLDVGVGTGWFLDNCSWRTILGRGVSHNLLGRRLMRLYNRKRIFSNLEDDQQGLAGGLASELTEVEIQVIGAVALFAGRA